MATEKTVADVTSDAAISAAKEGKYSTTATNDIGAQSGNFTIDIDDGYRQIANLTGSGAVQITVPTFVDDTNRMMFILDVSAYTGTLTFSGVDQWLDMSEAAPDPVGRDRIPILLIFDGTDILAMDLGTPVDSIEINAQTGTTYTLVIGDAGKLVTMSNGSANTFTIPANSAVPFKIGTRVDIAGLGAGTTTIAITTDTLNSEGGLLDLAGQYAMASLVKITSTSWLLAGSLA